MKDLPAFRKRKHDRVTALLTEILTHPDQPTHSFFSRLIQYDDGHYRAIFDGAYFVLRDGQTEPSKSQWNNLKKKLKRHAKQVFIFKEHGAATCDGPARRCFYLDFGFFAG